MLFSLNKSKVLFFIQVRSTDFTQTVFQKLEFGDVVVVVVAQHCEWVGGWGRHFAALRCALSDSALSEQCTE